MAYNFDIIHDRRNAGSIKWNFYPEDILPMWVADMDFASPNAIRNALHEKAEHGIFGYETSSETLINTVCERMERLYGWTVLPQHVIVLPGLVTGLNVACRAFAQPGEGVLIQTPVYPPFLSAPKNNKLLVQPAPLTYMPDPGSDHTFHYEIDYDVFESAITDKSKLFLICHPHNPIGQSYTRDQLTRMGDICLRHNLVMCSDEIHAELLLNGQAHIPLATVSPEIADRIVTLIAPSKTFNVAGLGCGFAIVPNPELHQKMRLASEGVVPIINAFGLAGALAAYRDDPDVNDWLMTLRQYLAANRNTLVDFVSTQVPALRITVPEATYLAWLDCRAAGLDDPYEFFLQKAKVGLNDGFTFGENGKGFVRLNFGCPRATLMKGLERMKAALSQ